MVSSFNHSTKYMWFIYKNCHSRNASLLPYIGWSCLIISLQAWQISKWFTQSLVVCEGKLFFILQSLSHKRHVGTLSLLFVFFFHDIISDAFRSLVSPVQTSTIRILALLVEPPAFFSVPIVKKIFHSFSFSQELPLRGNWLQHVCFPKNNNLDLFNRHLSSS